MFYTAIAVTLFGVKSCTRVENTPSGDGSNAISVIAEFDNNTPLATQSAPTRATATAFEVGDRLGIYVSPIVTTDGNDGSSLLAENNYHDNALMVARVDPSNSSKTIILGDPVIYYPDRSTGADLYAYYPYTATIADNTAMPFMVELDQSIISGYNASDLCWGRAFDATSLSNANIPITFSHRMAQLAINLTVPASVGELNITSINAVRLMDVERDRVIDLSDGAITSPTTPTIGSISALHTGAGLVHNVAMPYIAVLPAQSFAADNNFVEVEVELTDPTTNDVTTELYYYTIKDRPITLQAGVSNTLNLTLNDATSSLLLDFVISIEPWVVVTPQEGEITESIDNDFTLLWAYPDENYEDISSLVAHLRNPITDEVIEYTTTDLTLNAAESDEEFAKYAFSIEIPEDSSLTYPYQIDSLVFLDDMDAEITAVSSVMAQNVTRSGPYTIAVDLGSILVVTEGTIEDWDELVDQGYLGGEVTDETEFILHIVSPQFLYSEIDTIKMGIGNNVYSFPAAGLFDPASTSFLIQSFPYDFTQEVEGHRPAALPFTIYNISFINSSGDELPGGMYTSNILVNTNRTVNIQLQNEEALEVTAGIDGGYIPDDNNDDWNPNLEVNNNFGLLYTNSGATSATSCLSVTKMTLVIGGEDVAISGYSMTGTGFFAHSEVARPLSSATGTLPTEYPYSITAVKLYNGADEELANYTLPIAIEVKDNRDVAISVMIK